MRSIKTILLSIALILCLTSASTTSSSKATNQEYLAELVKATGSQPRPSAYLVSFHSHDYNYTKHFQKIGRDFEIDNTTDFIWHDSAKTYYVANLTDDWLGTIRRDPAVHSVEEFEIWEMGSIDPAGEYGNEISFDIPDAWLESTVSSDLEAVSVTSTQESKEEHLAPLQKAGKHPKPGEYFVLFHDNKDYDLTQHFSTIGHELAADDSIVFKSYDDLKVYMVKNLPEDLLDKIRRDPAVESVERNDVIEASAVLPVPNRLVDLRWDLCSRDLVLKTKEVVCYPSQRPISGVEFEARIPGL